jgi:hypothetical protein
MKYTGKKLNLDEVVEEETWVREEKTTSKIGVDYPVV